MVSISDSRNLFLQSNFLQAIKDMHLKVLSNGCTLRVGLLKDPSEAENNLFVKNLSEKINDADLNKMFSRFGRIISATVMKNDSKSKGFGFVCFGSPRDAAVK